MDKVLKVLGGFIGITSENLKKAIEADSVDGISFEGLKVMKEADITQIKENSKRDGITEAKAEFLPSIIEASGIEGTFKSVDAVFNAVKKNALKEAKIEPNNKIEELTAQLTTAQNTISDKETQLSKKDSEISIIARNSKIASKLPLKSKSGLSRDDQVLLLTNGLETTFENGDYFPLKNGKKEQDDKGNFINLDTFIDSKIEAKGWNVPATIEQTGGKGGGNVGGTGGSLNSVTDIKSTQQHAEYCAKNDINQNGQKGQLILSNAMQSKDFSDE